MRLRMSGFAFLALAAGLLIGAVPSDAAERKLFDAESFRAAQAAGAPVLVDITASWCPTCQAQKPIIDSLARKPEYEQLVILEVDFDTQKDVVRAFNARSQSTLIGFRGEIETARSVGDTDPASIEALMRTTITQ
jgi:thiol-disulfide isomerase/thioredoxin